MSTNNEPNNTLKKFEVLDAVYNEDGSVRRILVHMPLKDLREHMCQAKEKMWRNKILRFYDKDATFIFNDSPVNHAMDCVGEAMTGTFEPCVLGRVVSCSNGVLEFETDRGTWFVKFRNRKELRKMVYDSKMDAMGHSARFSRMMQESHFRHGDLSAKAHGLETDVERSVVGKKGGINVVLPVDSVSITKDGEE